MTNPTQLSIKPRFLASIMERILGLHRLGKIYDRRPLKTIPKDFLDYTLEALGVSNVVENEENLDEIPKEGPLLIVANHPLGGLEGMALAQEILKIRPDLQVLTNELLRKVQQEHFLKVCIRLFWIQQDPKLLKSGLVFLEQETSIQAF